MDDKDAAAVLTVILYTGCRAGEALAYTGAQRDGDTWTLPVTKSGQQHRIFLSPAAKAALERDAFTLRKERLGEAQRELVAKLGHPRWTPHDLRRSAATWWGEQGATNELLDRLLNHSSASRVQKTYNTARLDKPAKEAWTAWATYLDVLRSGVDK
jgi:integrase